MSISISIYIYIYIYKLRRMLMNTLWREISKSYELICNKFNDIECKNQNKFRIFLFNLVDFFY